MAGQTVKIVLVDKIIDNFSNSKWNTVPTSVKLAMDYRVSCYVLGLNEEFEASENKQSMDILNCLKCGLKNCPEEYNCFKKDKKEPVM